MAVAKRRGLTSWFLDPTLAAGGAALVVATKVHRDALADELKARGLNIDVATQEGRYLALDAADTLEQFMVEGWPDEVLCKQVLSALIGRIKASVGESGPPTGVFETGQNRTQGICD
jgi:hypothetical protein